jgi:multimeric flavodoxin WrbA
MSDKKIIILMGSPRKNGNSSALAHKAAEGIISEKAEFESFFLHEMNIQACNACDSCQNQKDQFCIIEDDMQLLYPKIRDAHGLLIASPVYWFTISAQTKLFMDRWYAFESPEGSVLMGKSMGVILTYGDTDPFTSGAVNALRTFQDAFRYIGASMVGTVYGSATDPGEIVKNREVTERAFELGRKLVL